MKHFNITFKPDGRQISVHAGAALLEAAGQAGIVLNTVCGGKGTCEKCIVNIEPGGRQVLACQHRIQNDLTVTIPPSSRFFEHKILSHGIDAKTEVRPDVYEKYKKTASTGKIFGVAVDIGTTTVVAKLVDMENGQCLATQADLNPQTRFGDDVISRINYAQTDAKLAELHRTIIDCINILTAKLCSQASIDAKQIYEMCVVGNTTMNHIFLKLPVAQLGQAPYKAFSLDAKDLSPEKMALQINPAGNIHTVENIAGFVGSDTTAVALAVDINSARDLTLVVDIGTNGEIVLGNKDKLYAASCAAGPAFEGARISCGSRAVNGAIEAVIVNDSDIDFDVIGNCPPYSICGSGLIDAVAVLLDLGIIDRTGRFANPGKLPPARLQRGLAAPRRTILSRIIQQNGQPAFRLADKVILTQQDIRQIQLAKAAIRAGIKLLQKKIGLEDDDIKQVLLAGAFGNYIRRESALRIGLLPCVPPERIHFIGNAAASGAEVILLSRKCRAQAKKLARKIKYVEIAHEEEFESVFTDSMMF
ncbi:MAG: ASKHA domain-containing protein [Sedimentisphaerales bacterium]